MSTEKSNLTDPKPERCPVCGHVSHHAEELHVCRDPLADKKPDTDAAFDVAPSEGEREHVESVHIGWRFCLCYREAERDVLKNHPVVRAMAEALTDIATAQKFGDPKHPCADAYISADHSADASRVLAAYRKATSEKEG